MTTPANTNDVTQAHALLHGEESVAFGDAGYQGVEKREENRTPGIKWHVAMRPGKRKALPNNELGRIDEKIEKLKASVRAKVEHPFHIVKNIFQLKKFPANAVCVCHLQQLADLFSASLISTTRVWRSPAFHQRDASICRKTRCSAGA